MLGLGRGRCGGLGRHRGESSILGVAVSCTRADGGITTYVCIHEYVVFSVVCSGGRDTVLIHRIRSSCAGMQTLGIVYRGTQRQCHIMTSCERDRRRSRNGVLYTSRLVRV